MGALPQTLTGALPMDLARGLPSFKPPHCPPLEKSCGHKKYKYYYYQLIVMMMMMMMMIIIIIIIIGYAHKVIISEAICN